MEFLLTTLEYHARNPFMLVSRTSGESESDTVLDVLIKLIRVIANMSVNAEVGCGLGARPPLGAVLLTLLLTNNKSKANLVGFNINIIQSLINFVPICNFRCPTTRTLAGTLCCRAATWRNCCWLHWAPYTIYHSIR